MARQGILSTTKPFEEVFACKNNIDNILPTVVNAFKI
jgi:hypothetical protein